MASNYTAPLNIDKNGTPMHSAPAPKLAVQRFVNENATASSVMTMSQDTTKIEIATGGVQAALRWIPTTDTQASVVAIAGATANFDHIIPPNTYRTFVVPVESSGTQAPSSQVGANRLNGLYQRYALKTQGVGSVLATEYP
jgi:hypothetical protein